MAAAATAIGVTALAAASGPGTAGQERHGGGTRPIRVNAGPVAAVDIQGVPGQLAIAGTGSGAVTLTGQLNWAGRAPAVVTRLKRASGVLLVSIRCAPASPCTQDLRLTVPARTAAAVRQPAGRVQVTGLSGPLRITAARADVSASALRSPELAAVIKSGHLNATFAAPPRRVAITLASAQATLRLPTRADYRVIRRVTSGYVSVAIPQASGAAGTITACLNSGELQVLPS